MRVFCGRGDSPFDREPLHPSSGTRARVAYGRARILRRVPLKVCVPQTYHGRISSCTCLGTDGPINISAPSSHFAFECNTKPSHVTVIIWLFYIRTLQFAHMDIDGTRAVFLLLQETLEKKTRTASSAGIHGCKATTWSLRSLSVVCVYNRMLLVSLCEVSRVDLVL